MVKKGKVEDVSVEFVQKLAAVLGVQPEEVFADYAGAKAAYLRDIEQNREFIFKDIGERNAAIESMIPLAKVCRTQMKPGTKFLLLFNSWNILRMTLRTA